MRKRPDLAERNRQRANPNARSRHPLFVIWKTMVARCHSQASKDFKNYGGRGITVCAEWRESFEAFVRDMGPRPSSLHQIDRTDNNGNHEPVNCAWRLPADQARNRRSSRLIEHDGRSMTLAEWSRETGISRVLIAHRIKAGWPVADALALPASRSLNYRRGSTKEVCT